MRAGLTFIFLVPVSKEESITIPLMAKFIIYFLQNLKIYKSLSITSTRYRCCIVLFNIHIIHSDICLVNFPVLSAFTVEILCL